MTKYPFTNAGFQALQIELYALSNPELHLEAEKIRADFKSWMNGHFILSQDQLQFLSNINDEARTFIAFQTSFAVKNRLPVYLNKILKNPGIQINAGEEPPVDGKIIRTKSKLTAGSDNQGGFNPSGELEIEISYV